MKAAKFSVLFAALAAAHSSMRTVTIDGNLYSARDVRVDRKIGVKRIEWDYDDVNGFPAMAVSDVNSPAMACGLNPRPPELKAVARAGANITAQWTGIVANHMGPVMSYLGAYTPGQKPQDIKFFKIDEKGYDKARKKWANEDLIANDHTDSFLLPSDIKPGLYVLRTELLALHGNFVKPAQQNAFFGGPQFYTHCYNIEIKGDGTATPEGVTFPGGYKKDEPGVTFNLNTPGRENYVVPGPPRYNGKYVHPSGPGPTVDPADRGVFPPEFEAKYQALKKKANDYMYGSINAVNSADPTGGNMAALATKLSEQVWKDLGLAYEVFTGISDLQKEAIRLGIATPGGR